MFTSMQAEYVAYTGSRYGHPGVEENSGLQLTVSDPAYRCVKSDKQQSSEAKAAWQMVMVVVVEMNGCEYDVDLEAGTMSFILATADRGALAQCFRQYPLSVSRGHGLTT